MNIYLILAPFYQISEGFNYWQFAALTGLFFLGVTYLLIRFKFFHTIFFALGGILIGWILWITATFTLPSAGFALVYWALISPTPLAIGFLIGLILGVRKDFSTTRAHTSNGL